MTAGFVLVVAWLALPATLAAGATLLRRRHQEMNR